LIDTAFCISKKHLDESRTNQNDESRQARSSQQCWCACTCSHSLRLHALLKVSHLHLYLHAVCCQCTDWRCAKRTLGVCRYAAVTQPVWRGAAKKKIDGPPRTFTKSQTHPPTIRLFFFLTFFLVRFWAFLGKGSSKTPQKCFYKKSKISTKFFDVSFSSTFFVLSRFPVFLSDGSSKTLQKTFCKKNRVEKFFQFFFPLATKNPKPTFSQFVFNTFLGVSR
jgi:hypothetical protein